MIDQDALTLLHRALTQQGSEDLTIMSVTRSGESIHVEEDAFNRADGQPLPVSYTASPYYKDDRVEGVIVAFEDISERKELNEKLTRLALYDELTGLYNRRQVENLLKHLFNNAQRFEKSLCIAMIDVDYFKKM